MLLRMFCVDPSLGGLLKRSKAALFFVGTFLFSSVCSTHMITDIIVRAETLFTQVSFYLNKLVIALVIILFGFIIGKIVERTLRILLAKLDTDEKLARLFKVRRNYARAIRRTIVRLIYLVTILIALNTLRLLSPVIVMLVFLAVIVITISIILAGIDVFPNLAARATLIKKRITIGDEIVISTPGGNVHGTIVDMTLTDVHIKRRNGDLFFIPNSVFLNGYLAKKRA